MHMTCTPCTRAAPPPSPATPRPQARPDAPVFQHHTRIWSLLGSTLCALDMQQPCGCFAQATPIGIVNEFIIIK
eukprot:5359462-Lingulodinium_polyedra.AAC.1